MRSIVRLVPFLLLGCTEPVAPQVQPERAPPPSAPEPEERRLPKRVTAAMVEECKTCELDEHDACVARYRFHDDDGLAEELVPCEDSCCKIQRVR